MTAGFSDRVDVDLGRDAWRAFKKSGNEILED